MTVERSQTFLANLSVISLVAVFLTCSCFLLNEMKSFSRFPGEKNKAMETFLTQFTRETSLAPNWFDAIFFSACPPERAQCQIEVILSLPLKRSKAKSLEARGRKANDHGSGKNVESKFEISPGIKSVFSVFSKIPSKQISSFSPLFV